VTDEELENYNEKIIKKCPSCGSKNVSIRRARLGEFIYGCQDCFQHNICDKTTLDYAIEFWNRMAMRSRI
jgi:ssDNA-binding Zn-finger/Zn-ribbon topoisomerase 1